MLDQGEITQQVARNCAVSDAGYAGYYTVCGLALRMRDLYKWEKGLSPWEEEEPGVLLDWIGQKEEAWEKLVEEEIRPLTIMGASFDPFDAAGINEMIESEGLFYGAGYMHSLKPSFFLARLDEKKKVDGACIYYLGKELARDMFIVPALSQGDHVIVRKQAGELFFWNQIFFAGKSAKQAIGFALKAHGLPEHDHEKLIQNFHRIFSEETEAYLYHELGEMQEAFFDRHAWRDLIRSFPHTPVELFARTVKDLLADTNESGKLQYIVQAKKQASLAFHVAFLDGLRKTLFPEIMVAFGEFTASGDWRLIQAAIAAGYERGKAHAQRLVSIYRAGKEKNDLEWMEKEVWKQLLIPLGIVKEVPKERG